MENNLLCDKEIITARYSNAQYLNLLDSSYEAIKNKKEIEHLLLD